MIGKRLLVRKVDIVLAANRVSCCARCFACYSGGEMVYFSSKLSRSTVGRSTRSLFLGILFLLPGVLLWCGCSGSSGVAADARHSGSAVALVDTTDPRAMKHFIDGITYELGQDPAKAILEFQDALRYSRDPAIYFALSRNYSFIGKHALGIEAGREAVRLAPGNLEYRKSLADVYFTAFQLDSAAQQYEEIIRQDSSDASAWYSLGRIYETRKPLKALGIYEQILTRFGPDWNVLLQVGELYNKQGQYDKAAAALLQMKEIDPSNQPLQRRLAQTYVQAVQYEEALKIYASLRELDPANLEYLADVGGIYLLMKDYPKAAGYFDPILKRDTVAIEVKLRIGQLYYDQVEKDSSLVPLTRSIFERIRVSYPKDWRPYWFLGALAAMSHDDSASAKNFSRMTELAGWNPDGWVGLALSYFGKNNFSEAARVLESGQKQVPNDFRLNYFLGVAYNRLGQANEAARSLEAALKINPKDFEAVAELAMVYDALKRYEESDSLYEIAIVMDHSQRHLALNNFAYSLSERGEQLDRANRMVDTALQAQPENDSYLDTKGWVCFKLGNYQEAEKYILKAIAKSKEKGDPSATVYEHLGDIYYKMNDRQRALENWKAALKIAPDNATLQEKVSRGSL
jgi:tetratricopeptide (TPR) repeat protein